MTAPLKLEIDLDLDAYLVRFQGYDNDGNERVEPQSLETIIIDQAAGMLAKQAQTDALKDDWNSLRTHVQKIRDEEIRARIVPLIEEALTTPLLTTNNYGESDPNKPPVTLRDLVLKEARQFFVKRADSFGRDAKQTAIDAFIAAAVKDVISKELKGTLDEATAQVRAAVVNEGAKLIEQAIAKTAGVR